MLCVRVACLLTFAAQQSILQMNTHTIKVTYGGCVYVAPLKRDLSDTGRLPSPLTVSYLAHWSCFER